ncbi:MAG: KEOPS complex subunit Pcc1 [Thermoplasmata archaeon]
MNAPTPWTATIRIHRSDRRAADHLAEVLAPESTREVPRAQSRVRVEPPSDVVLEIETRDTGALRAAMNTFLGWVQLALATEAAARATRPPSD